MNGTADCAIGVRRSRLISVANRSKSSSADRAVPFTTFGNTKGGGVIQRRKVPKEKSKIDWAAIEAAGGIGKGEPRKVTKAREERWYADAREVVTRLSYHRDSGRCQKCKALVYWRCEDPLALAHGHEIVPRSAGGDPLDIRNVVTLCAKCHLLGAHKQGAEAGWFTIIILNPLAGANGPLRFAAWVGKWSMLKGEQNGG